MHKRSSKLSNILTELFHHLPFSMFGVMTAILMMGVLTYAIGGNMEATFGHEHGGAHGHDVSTEIDLFHVFHAMHVLMSAVATTAMFWRHDNHNVIKAVIIGIVGSVTVCGLSDIIVPYVGGLILGMDMHLHICLIEEPSIVWPFAIIGVVAGFAVTRTFEMSTQFSHSLHVFISSVASLLFLMSFGLFDWMHAVSSVFVIILIAVMLPCCLSDIVFPMMCTHRYCSKEDDQALHHISDV